MIHVVFYGYKSKNILDACIALRNNAISKDIEYSVIEKSNIKKTSKYNEIGIKYYYNKWDSLTSKYTLIHDVVANKHPSDYILLINDAIVLQKGWDEFLLSLNESNSLIISGYKKVFFDDYYKFFPKTFFVNSDKLEKTNWVEDNIIFGRLENLRKIMSSSEKLKQNGFNVLASFNAFVNNVDVYSIPTSMVDDSMSTFDTQDYYPFSRNHNYNELIKYIKGKESLFGKLEMDTIHRFNERMSYGFDRLVEIPFIVNDTEYDQHMEIDDLSEKRFLNIVKSIG